MGINRNRYTYIKGNHHEEGINKKNKLTQELRIKMKIKFEEFEELI